MAESSYGIYAYGAKVDASTAKANGIVAGDYTINDLSIDNNTITVEENSSKSYGIYITGVNKSEISSNTLTDYSSAKDGIDICECIIDNFTVFIVKTANSLFLNIFKLVIFYKNIVKIF